MFLRAVTKSKWYKNPNVVWLPESELQADALADIKTSCNCLSVYQVPEEENGREETIKKIMAAILCTKDSITDLAYTLISRDFFSSLETPLVDNTGNTADKEINDLHQDVSELTANKLQAIAEHIKGLKKIKVLPKDLLPIANSRIQERLIDFELIKLKNKENLFKSG